jgi:hypothetical protein
MGTNTVITVPPWAEEYVTLYAERSRALSAAMGTEPRFAAGSALTGSGGTLTNPELAYDGSASTYAEIWSDTANSAFATFSGFTAAVETYTSLSLRIRAALVFQTNGNMDGCGYTVRYSLDGGGTWTNLWQYPAPPFTGSITPVPGGTFSKTNVATLTASLPIATNLTLLQVEIGVHPTDEPQPVAFFIYEVSTAGYYALPEGTTGALQVYSGPIFAAQPQDEIDGIAGLATRGRYGDQVITKAIAYEDDVINGGYLGGTKASFLAALSLVTGNSTTDFGSVNSRIGRKPYYVGDPDSTFLAQSLVVGVPALYNARVSALIYADNFRKERVIQDHALGYGVEMGKHAAIDGETLRRAGLYQREYVQYGYTMSHKLFLEEQELAVVNLEIFGNCLRALTGSQQTTTQDFEGGNKLTSAVGMGMAGGVIGFYIGGGPPGAAIGFVVGSVAGYLLA